MDLSIYVNTPVLWINDFAQLYMILPLYNFESKQCLSFVLYAFEIIVGYVAYKSELKPIKPFLWSLNCHRI